MIITLIPQAKITEITGATTEEEIKSYDDMAASIIENYRGVKLLKTTITDETKTMPYGLSRVITPVWGNINSVTAFQVVSEDGTYHDLPAAASHMSVGKYGIELLFNFNDVNIHTSQWADLFRPTVIPAKVASVKLSYIAGLWDTYDDPNVPALLRLIAAQILDWFINGGGMAGMKSETMGSYSYTKEELQNGLPQGIAMILDGLRL
ncbi:hypothetical protein Dip510_001644 [Elusimicrobium posterum]|uniref:hypothetical protein n=1 Tax=Elusimicrobium posterum TaxID=3116653 RepID=UPI003C784054